MTRQDSTLARHTTQVTTDLERPPPSSFSQPTSVLIRHIVNGCRIYSLRGKDGLHCDEALSFEGSSELFLEDRLLLNSANFPHFLKLLVYLWTHFLSYFTVQTMHIYSYLKKHGGK